MSKLRLICLLLLFSTTSYQGLGADENRKTKNYENFSLPMGGEKYISEDYRTYPELSVWALHNGMKLAPDRKDAAPGAGTGILFDNQCRMIPVDGLEVLLVADPDRKDLLYIYLDLTLYQISSSSSALQKRELRIFVNGIEKERVRFPNQNLYQKSIYSRSPPVRIEVDPAELVNGRMIVKLEPDPGDTGRFWGIWDIFYSYNKED
ncbi:hypothetical protein CH373_03385 [Leptospira perolatii]|uniref:Uncharacterized protein n=1 Tax=Leptospira perolatii TaxID=2023191 RepID=A0A2M9ZT23_9LEPT|nr:hypothetical protein [Leptospira perolatii]PJZ68087.1 hypothetical protein CH360_18015 [Leptospira perolatii]PJZ75073.1 hypothetical protein CH373_03385 [Leptospira perolatii]